MKTLLTIIALTLLTTANLFAFSGNGYGTEADPYQITNIEQLQEMNDELDAHYILMNDIDAIETREWNVGDHDDSLETSDSAMGFEPIGDFTAGTPSDGFTGSLDGQDYTISNLYINRPSEGTIGLFGCIADGGYVHEVLVEDANVTGGSFIGIFVGISCAFDRDSETLIERCSSSGNIRGDNAVGGFCGSVKGDDGISRVRDCYSTADASGFESIGGFCGYNCASDGYTYIIDCYSEGNAIGDQYIGGFCGWNYANTNLASIRKSYSTGNATGKTCIGGFCGRNYADCGSNVQLFNCYSTGNSIGDVHVGSFCGANIVYTHYYPSYARIYQCYSTGHSSENGKIKGFCGIQDWCQDGYSYVHFCYWDTETSGTTESDGGAGKTTSEMKRQATFETWDFYNIWCIGERETYPQLQHFTDCDTLTSVEENPLPEKFGISIYPNPADDFISISTNHKNLGFERIQIINLLGVEVWNGRAISDKMEIDVSILPSGVYFLRIGNNAEMFVKK